LGQQRDVNSETYRRNIQTRSVEFGAAKSASPEIQGRRITVHSSASEGDLNISGQGGNAGSPRGIRVIPITVDGKPNSKVDASNGSISEKEDFDSARARLFEKISAIPVRRSRGSDGSIGIPVRVISSPVVTPRQNCDRSNQADAGLMSGRQESPAGRERLSSVERTWETYSGDNRTTAETNSHSTANKTPKENMETYHRRSVSKERREVSNGSKMELVSSQNYSQQYHSRIEQNSSTNGFMSTKNCLDEKVLNGPEVMEVIIRKGGLGLGFCIEGGKGTTGGDRPITVKRLFRAAAGQNGGDSSPHELRPHVGQQVPDGGSLRPGDELLLAEGRDLSQLSHYVAWNYLKSLPDGQVRLTIRRSSRS